jgi:hypothetical protein
LVASGVPMVAAALAHSEDEAVALLRRFNTAVAVKAEAPGLLHKSDLVCVRLGCTDEQAVREAYAAVVRNARNAGFDGGVLIQPMITGVAEAYAGIIDDPLFPDRRPAASRNPDDTVTEMAPLTRDSALAMIHHIKGAPLLSARAVPRRRGALAACWSPWTIRDREQGTRFRPRPQSHHRRQERRGRRRYRHRAHHGGRRDVMPMPSRAPQQWKDEG